MMLRRNGDFVDSGGDDGSSYVSVLEDVIGILFFNFLGANALFGEQGFSPLILLDVLIYCILLYKTIPRKKF